MFYNVRTWKFKNRWRPAASQGVLKKRQLVNTKKSENWKQDSEPQRLANGNEKIKEDSAPQRMPIPPMHMLQSLQPGAKQVVLQRTPDMPTHSLPPAVANLIGHRELDNVRRLDKQNQKQMSPLVRLHELYELVIKKKKKRPKTPKKPRKSNLIYYP